MINYHSSEDELEVFTQAANGIKDIKTRLNNDELLKLYGLYKQGLEGNNKIAEPGIFDVRAKAKWNAWKAEAGKGRGHARREYIEYTQVLKNKYDLRTRNI